MTIEISMLLPTRGRPKHLKNAIDSAFRLAANPESIEMLVQLDRCDPSLKEAIDVLREHRWTEQIRMCVAPRVGYSGMHLMNNALAECANPESKWLHIWNDDLEMLTPGWDVLLLECPPFAIQFPRRDTTATSDHTVPVMGMPVYRAIGRMSGNAFCDAWIADVSAFAGTSVTRDDVLFHHYRFEDATAAGSNDGGREWERFRSAEQRAERHVDREKIVSSPEWAGRFDGWDVVEEPHVGIDYINLMGTTASARSYRLRERVK
jgi:hypothetical protein